MIPIVDSASLTSITNRDSSPQRWPQADLTLTILQMKFPLPDDSELCQVDIKNYPARITYIVDWSKLLTLWNISDSLVLWGICLYSPV